MNRILDPKRISQIGLVVNDIETVKREFARLFNCEVPVTQSSGDYEKTQTTVEGVPSPEAGSLLAFFDLAPGIQLELIQPNDQPSAWRKGLNEKGEGIHHIAFNVDNTEETVRQLEKQFGGKVEQEGNYHNEKGHYTYVNLQDQLKFRVELLENYDD